MFEEDVGQVIGLGWWGEMRGSGQGSGFSSTCLGCHLLAQGTL